MYRIIPRAINAKPSLCHHRGKTERLTKRSSGGIMLLSHSARVLAAVTRTCGIESLGDLTSTL